MQPIQEEDLKHERLKAFIHAINFTLTRLQIRGESGDGLYERANPLLRLPLPGTNDSDFSTLAQVISHLQLSCHDAEPTECAITAFWKHLAAQSLGTNVVVPEVPAGQFGPLEHLGALLTALLSLFPEPSLALLATCYLLHLAGGWALHLCRCTKPQSPFGNTSFLLLRPSGSRTNLIVDLGFADKFRFARVTPHCRNPIASQGPSHLASLVEAFPAAFVGTEATLMQCIDHCSQLVADSFSLLGMDLPPWRRSSHLQSVYRTVAEEPLLDMLTRVDRSLHAVARGTRPPSSRLGAFARRMLSVLQELSEMDPDDEPPCDAAIIAWEVVGPFLDARHVEQFVHHLASSGCQTCFRAPQRERALTFEKEAPAAAPPTPPESSLLSQWLAVRKCAPKSARCPSTPITCDGRDPLLERFSSQ